MTLEFFSQVFPSEVEGMKESVLRLYDALKPLAAYVFRLMAISLELEVRITIVALMTRSPRFSVIFHAC